MQKMQLKGCIFFGIVSFIFSPERDYMTIVFREPLKTMFLEVGVWGEAPHIALLLFAEKQKGRFLEMPLTEWSMEKQLTANHHFIHLIFIL